MKNPEILKSAIRKLVENLFLRNLNKDDYDLLFHPRFEEQPAVYLEIDVDLERINPNHPKYDSEYTNTVFDMDTISEKIQDYIGLSHNDLQFFTTPNYKNEDYVWGEIDFVRDSIKKHLLNKGYSRKDVNDLEVWVNLYTREDDSPFVRLEVGVDNEPTEEQIEEIKNSSYESLNKTKYLRSLVDGEIEFWHDY
jgi:hypothetical protein